MAPEPGVKSPTKKIQARARVERTQRRILLWGAGIIFALILMIITIGLLDQFVLKSNRAVAVVNGEKITVSEFQSQVKYSRWQLIQQYISNLEIYQFLETTPGMGASFAGNLQQIMLQLNAAYATNLGESILDQMIENKLIRQEAKKLGITISDDEVERVIQGAFFFFPDGTPTPQPTPVILSTSTLSPAQQALIRFTSTPTTGPTATQQPTEIPVEITPTVGSELELEPTSTPFPTPTQMTIEGYQTEYGNYLELLKNEINFSEKELRQLVENQLYVEKLLDHLTSDLAPLEEQVWARHILVDDETVAKLLIAQLEDGIADWYDLAATYSTDTSNKDKGGDLGWFGKGMMVPPFEEAAFSLEVGKISGPVKTDFGWHIIQVIAKEDRSLTEAQFQNLKNQKFDEWLQELKQTSVIEKKEIWQNVIPTEPNIPPELLINVTG